VKVLVATKTSQGQRANDYCWVPEGEIVLFGSECDREDVDGSCGCRRALCGIESGKATTTMQVAEIDITPVELKRQVRNSLIRGGWIDLDVRDDNEFLAALWDDMVGLSIADWPVGTIVEKRGDEILERVT
jgi:hypothetical protein